MRLIGNTFFLLLLMLVQQTALAADGHFLSVVGDVRVVDARGGVARPERGGPIEAGDTVITGSPALAQIRMTDGGLISVRADTEMKLSDYAFAGGEDSAGRVLFDLLRGGLRSITGLIGARNRAAYSVRTPHATIGIRGTDHITHVNLQARPDLPAGTVDAVLQGGTYLRPFALPGGAQPQVLEVRPQQAGFVPADTRVPTLIPVPAFILPQRGELEVRARTGDTREASAAGDDSDPAGSPRRRGAPARAPSVVTKGDGDGSRPTVQRAPLINPLINPLTSPTRTLSPELSTGTRTLSPTLTSPELSTTIKSLDTTTTQTLESGTTTISPTLTSPTTSTLTSPTTSTLTSPTKTLSPTTSTLTSPTTSTLTSPTTSTLRSPTTSTLTSPTTSTLTSPTTSTLTSPTTSTLTSPTQTLSPTTTEKLKTLSPQTTTTIRK